MSSKDEETDKPDEAGDAPSRQKRPAQTIDLKADEVEIEIREVDATDKDGGEGDNKAPDEDKKSGDAQTAASDADETKPGGASKPAGNKGAIPDRKPPPAPQRTRPSDVRGFVTHLAAGLVGGLVGVVGAGVGLDRLPIPGLGAPDAPGQDLAQLEQRIETLSAKVQEQPAASGAASPEKLGELEERLAAIEKKPPPDAPPIPENLETRLAGLEDTLKALQASGGEAGAGTLEQSAALVARIDAIEQATREKVDTLANDLSQARAAIDKAASSAAPASDTAALEAMSRRIGGLEKSLSDAAARPDTGGGPQASRTGAVALAYESLRRVAQGGEPFKAQLDVLAKITGPRDELEPLGSSAEKGVPTRAALLEKWPSVLEQARLEAGRADDETFLDRLASNASAVVRIRRVEQAKGAAAEAGAHNSLEAAIRQAGSLEGAAANSASPWLEQARARVALDTALEALEAALLSGLTGAPPEKG